MYVQHPTVVSPRKLGVENSHKAGQNHQVRSEAIDLLVKSMIERLAIIKTVVIDYGGLDSGVLGALNTFGLRFIADYTTHLRRYRAVFTLVDEDLLI